jgi:hypothetical protein
MRCPVCKADNSQGPQCRRCKADLSQLFILEAHRDWFMNEAKRHIGRGDWPEAACQAAQAHRIRKDEDSYRLLALAHLLGRNYAQAWDLCRRRLSAKPSDGTANAS